MKLSYYVVAITLLMALPALAQPVSVSITGQVIFNGIANPPLNGVTSGQTAELSFMVDASNFVDGVPGDTRGYVIDQASFNLSFSGGVSVGIADPFPAGQTPYFTLVDGFPVSDGFFVSTSPVSPGGVPLSQDPVNVNFDVGYTGDTLSSLDILDAVGDYDFTGLTRFSLDLWQVFPDNVVLGMDFSGMSIVPEPSTSFLLAPFALWLIGRRR